MSSPKTLTTLADGGNENVDGTSSDEVQLGLEIALDDEANPISSPEVGQKSSDVKQLVDEDDDDDNPPCGWFGFRPWFIQFMNNPRGYLLFVCIFGFGQGMTVNGLIYVVTTTLERRFNLSSTRSGSISSCYDFSVMVIIVFVTYFGERSHKPKWLGTGALFFAMGSLLFTLPHFLTGPYEPRQRTEIATCDINGTGTGECEGNEETALSSYYWVFVAAQILHGIGASPLYTLNVSFLDDNVKPAVLALYVGIFQAMATLGPAFGYAMGGSFLSIYTDTGVDPAEKNLTNDSPLWVGAWWIGFFVTAGICLVAVIPLLGFPKELPGAKALRNSKAESSHKGATYVPRTGFNNKVMDFPRATWNLIRNLPYMCMNLASMTESFILASIAVFGPKYMESMFNFTPGTAALISGALTLPAALIGCLVGGFIIRYFKLGFRGQVKFCILVMSICLVTFTCFLIVCPNADFAGVTVNYHDSNTKWTNGDANLTASCNADCNCTSGYDPICGSDDILYYSPCYAGCLAMNEEGDKTTYSECKCIIGSTGGINPNSTAQSGKCDVSCNGLVGFFILVFTMLCSTFFAIVPSYTALVRCVALSQRTFALGLNSLLYRAGGAVPGPIVYGALIDSACLVWAESCGKKGSCWMYDNKTLARNTITLYMCLKAATIVFFSGALFFYRPAEDGEEGSSDDGDASSVAKEKMEENSNDMNGFVNKGEGTPNEDPNQEDDKTRL